MKKVKMKVVCSHRHNGKWVKPTDDIEVPTGQVADLIRLGRAKRVPGDTAAAPNKPAAKSGA